MMHPIWIDPPACAAIHCICIYLLNLLSLQERTLHFWKWIYEQMSHQKNWSNPLRNIFFRNFYEKKGLFFESFWSTLLFYINHKILKNCYPERVLQRWSYLSIICAYIGNRYLVIVILWSNYFKKISYKHTYQGIIRKLKVREFEDKVLYWYSFYSSLVNIRILLYGCLLR